ncbi:MAG: hypothetical protein WD847_03885 [Pirellulales bacterium]
MNGADTRPLRCWRRPAVWLVLAGAIAGGGPVQADDGAGVLRLNLRTRVETFKGSGQWDEVTIQKELPVDRTAILICDMWDDHWCTGAAKRCGALAEKMAPIIDQARSTGVRIIHSPSDTMGFYKDSPARKRLLAVELLQAEKNLDLTDPPLPIDDSDGGCDTPDSFFQAWTRQHPAIRVADTDVVGDRGDQIYSYLRREGVENIIFVGVHTNMCVLGRSFGIRQMTRWGMNSVLVRDLTDTMYDPADRPHVGHDEGTELVVQHIEKYFCPSIESADLVESLPARQP